MCHSTLVILYIYRICVISRDYPPPNTIPAWPDTRLRQLRMVIADGLVWHQLRHLQYHYSDVIMRVMASQITDVFIVCSTVYSGRSKKTSKLRVDGLYEGNSPVTGEFSAQRASNAENVSIWWRHHVLMWIDAIQYQVLPHQMCFNEKKRSLWPVEVYNNSKMGYFLLLHTKMGVKWMTVFSNI